MMRQQRQQQRDGHVVALLGDTANDGISPSRAETTVADVTAKNTNMMATTMSTAGSDDRKANKNTNAKNNKRKRLQEKQSLPGDEPEKRQQLTFQLLDDYYQRLVYQCHKDLNKHIKLTKNFLLQKQIRIIKEMTAATAKKEEGREEATKNVAKQQVKLQQMKDCFNLPNNKTVMNEMILQECDRRLGILQLDPKLLLLQQQQQQQQPNTATSTNTQLDMNDDNNDDSQSDDDDENTDTTGDNSKEAATTTAVPPPPPPKSLVTTTSTETVTAMTQRILQHKTIMTALERWHQEVTQYRIWSMQQQERLLLYHSSDDRHKYTTFASTFTTAKKQKKGTKVKEAVLPAHHSTGSMFVSLGQEDDDDDDDDRNQERDPDDPYSYYGPAGAGSGGTTKKNRQGQRGRRAKMAALQAKKLGRSIPKEESINWRRGGGGGGSSNNHTKSNHHDHDRNSTSRDAAPAQHPTNNNTATTTADPSSLHPSWQAKKESKASIVAFQGTKITFG